MPIHLKTTRTPQVASGHPSYRWEEPDDVVEVDDVTAEELLALVGAGFYEVPAPVAETADDPTETEATPDTDDAEGDGETPEADDADTGDKSSAKAPSRRSGSTKK